MKITIEKINQRFKELIKSRSIFGNVETIAAYDPLSQIIQIPGMEENKLGDRTNMSIMDSLHQTIVHELTHFYDHCSTIWGQKNLISIHQATEAYLSRDEKQFHIIAKLIAETRRVFFPYYYNVIGQIPDSVSEIVPWKYQYSCGQEYNSKGEIDNKFPIIFCSFLTQGESRRIARVPLSIMALTEANAVYSEVFLTQKKLAAMKGEERFIERNFLESKYKKLIYNKELTVYTVAAHIVANNLHISDIFVAYEYASLLSRLCLNLPDQYFDGVNIPKDTEDFGENNRTMLKIRDRGYLFFILSFWAPQINTTSDPVDWLEKTLHNSGLPKLSIITKAISEEMEKLQLSIQNGHWSDRFEYMLRTGREIFKHNPFYKEHYSILGLDNNIPVPPVLFGDGYQYSLPGNNFDKGKYALDEYFDVVWDYDKFARGFEGALKIGV